MVPMHPKALTVPSKWLLLKGELLPELSSEASPILRCPNKIQKVWTQEGHAQDLCV